MEPGMDPRRRKFVKFFQLPPLFQLAKSGVAEGKRIIETGSRLRIEMDGSKGRTKERKQYLFFSLYKQSFRATIIYKERKWREKCEACY